MRQWKVIACKNIAGRAVGKVLNSGELRGEGAGGGLTAIVR